MACFDLKYKFVILQKIQVSCYCYTTLNLHQRTCFVQIIILININKPYYSYMSCKYCSVLYHAFLCKIQHQTIQKDLVIHTWHTRLFSLFSTYILKTYDFFFIINMNKSLTIYHNTYLDNHLFFFFVKVQFMFAILQQVIYVS